MAMRKPLVLLGTVLTFGLVYLGGASDSVQAQQSSAAPAAGAPATAAQTAQTPATGAAAPSTFATDKEKDSYALGVNIGRSLKRQKVDLDTSSVMRGMKDALAGSQSLLTDPEIDAALKQLAGQAQQVQDAELAKAGEANMKEGEEFLAANKTKDGVVTLPSGLQYKILTTGTGAKPKASDTVVCNYRGTFINGTEFDSSYKRGQPASFPVGGVIKGWTEALQLMPVGSKWQLFVPPDLAYGQRGAGGAIGPNQTLVFDVELISIKGQ
jgi:FKBP-type peptidyl-prolyl cis-trans isomerase FklB